MSHHSLTNYDSHTKPTLQPKTYYNYAYLLNILVHEQKIHVSPFANKLLFPYQTYTTNQSIPRIRTYEHNTWYTINQYTDILTPLAPQKPNNTYENHTRTKNKADFYPTYTILTLNHRYAHNKSTTCKYFIFL